jgi:hypothetical protein
MESVRINKAQAEAVLKILNKSNCDHVTLIEAHNNGIGPTLTVKVPSTAYDEVGMLHIDLTDFASW